MAQYLYSDLGFKNLFEKLQIFEIVCGSFERVRAKLVHDLKSNIIHIIGYFKGWNDVSSLFKKDEQWSVCL